MASVKTNQGNIVYSEKTGHTSIGIILSMLKIYSRSLNTYLKSSYIFLKISCTSRFSSDSLPAGLPAVRPGSARCMAPDFSHKKGNRVGFMKPLFR